MTAQTFVPRRSLLCCAAIGMVLMGMVAGVRPAHAAHADILMLSSTIDKPDAHGNPLSSEEQAATLLGLSVDVGQRSDLGWYVHGPVRSLWQPSANQHLIGEDR